MASLCAAALAGCGDDGGDPPACVAVGTGARGYDALAYTLAARFDWATTTLTAHEQLTIACRAQPMIELDAEVAITAVAIDGRPAPFTVDAAAHTVAIDTGGVDGPVTLAIDYTSTPSDALLLRGPRDDDPVATPVLFTDSEPDRGRRWLVGNHDPADRATFAVELTVPVDHDVVADQRAQRDVGVVQRREGLGHGHPHRDHLPGAERGHVDERRVERTPLAGQRVRQGERPRPHLHLPQRGQVRVRHPLQPQQGAMPGLALEPVVGRGHDTGAAHAPVVLGRWWWCDPRRHGSPSAGRCRRTASSDSSPGVTACRCIARAAQPSRGWPTRRPSG